jgi:thiol-disulfide isomerase/thioredoxin
LLEARLISPFHRKRSREMIERVLRTAPDSPWPHLAAAEWSSSPVAPDPDFGARHLEEFSRLCPDSTRVFAHFDLVQNADRLARYVLDLRRRIEIKKKDGISEADLFLFRSIWPWEKAAASAGGEAEFGRTVRSDVAAIRALNLYDTAEWYSVLRMGHEQMLKDAAGLETLQQQILRAAPTSQTAWRIEEERDPRPPTGASRQHMERWTSETQARLLERISRFGARPFIGFPIHTVLFNPGSKLGDADVERLSDVILDLAEQFPDQGSSWPPVQLMVAEVYTRRKIRLGDVPDLVRQALVQIEYQEKYRRNSDAIPAGPRTMDNVALTQGRAREVLIRHALATAQTNRARDMLAEFRRTLEQTKPANNATATAMAWRRDHLVYRELAALAGLDVAPIPELLPPQPEAAERFPVGDFEAKDLSGRTWRLADLKGKVAYVSVWTTWCVPCRAEMPGLQKLHDRWKDSKDRVLLTISADTHEALARDFIAESKYTFPVVHGTTVAGKFFPPISFPQNWMIDPEGRRLGLNAPPAYDSTIAQIEELAARVGVPGR